MNDEYYIYLIYKRLYYILYVYFWIVYSITADTFFDDDDFDFAIDVSDQT